MKKSIKYIFNTLLFASCLTFFSCNNIFQNDENKGIVNKIKITANVDLGDGSRKAVPEDYSVYDSLSYILKATCNTDASYSTEIPFYGMETEFELIAANWSFELTASDAANTPILRSSENTNIDITEDTELNFKMVGLVNGSLEYKFLIGEFTEEELEGEELDFTNQKNPVLEFEFYKYKGSIQETLLEVTDTPDLVITEGTRETYEYIGEEVQMIEIPITIVHRKDSFSLPEGTYFVICKKADRSNEDPIVNEETVTEDDLKFFFQELVEIKAGLTTTSEYENINSALPKYKITLHTNGGSFIDYLPTVDTIIPNEYFTFSFNRGKRITQVIPEPKKVNNVFQGWFYDSELTKPFENPYGDGFPISNNNVEAFGNAELYAKWVPINGEKPEVLLYTIGLVSGDSNGKAVKSSSDWNTLLDTTYSGKQIVDTVSNSGNIYSLQKQTNTIKLLVNNIENDKIFTGSPVKIAVDSATNKLYILISDSSDNFYKKYSAVTYEDGEFSNVISLGDLSERGVCYFADVKGFAVHNGQIWLNFVRFSSSEDTDPTHSTDAYTTDAEVTNDYINLLYICTLDSSDNYVVDEKQTPDFLACLQGDLTNLKKYSFITDFAFKDNKVYATVKTSHYRNTDGFYNPQNPNTPNDILYFGGIIEIDQDTLLSKSLLSYNTNNTKNSNISYTDYDYDVGAYVTKTANYQYMGVNSQRDTTCLAGPTKILAIKEEELIMVDEGAFVWVDKSTGYHTDVNRIVVFDLQNNSIKYVCPINGQNIKFAEDWSASTGTVPGFVNVSGSVSSLFSD